MYCQQRKQTDRSVQTMLPTAGDHVKIKFVIFPLLSSFNPSVQKHKTHRPSSLAVGSELAET
jgi:hypothetical protein